MRLKPGNDSKSLSDGETTRKKRPFWKRLSSKRSDSVEPPLHGASVGTRQEQNDGEEERNQRGDSDGGLGGTKSTVNHNVNVVGDCGFQTAKMHEGVELHFEDERDTETELSRLDTSNNPKALQRSRSARKNPKARVLLSRPLGRESLPHKVARRWAVEVSPAEWDAEEDRWKYRVLVQRRSLQKMSKEKVENLGDEINSFTTAFTWRSLADFVWLEQALRAEFHGALLLPLLSIAIGTPNVASIEYEVESRALRDWLGDVMNGVRGQGEIVLEQDSVDLIGSEALEAFLYRNTDCFSLGTKPELVQSSRSQGGTRSTLDRPWQGSPEKEYKEASFVESLWAKPFACFPIDSLCANTESVESTRVPKAWTLQLPLDLMHCQSRAIGDADSLEIQDSFVEYAPDPMQSSDLVIHSDTLLAQRTLAAFHRKKCLVVMEKLRMLSAEEARVGAAWKRFAISVSNLFSYEKEVENSRVGERKECQKSPSQFRQLEKETVDELLRVVARQKYDRSIPSLKILESFLSGLAGDLSAVRPAVEAHEEAMAQLSQVESSSPLPSSARARRMKESKSWPDTLKSPLWRFWGLQKSNNKSFQTVTTTSTSDGETTDSNKRAFEQRLRKNEKQLQKSLNLLCRATPVRCARMAYKFFGAEASQANLLSSSAISLRTKINIADKEMLSVCARKNADEREKDDRDELNLVQKILNITSETKFSLASEEASKDCSHDKILGMAKMRLGRWDADLALTVMEAVGIEDAEVQVEETTRDLRLARRHAIGLRENLARCLDAVNSLRSAIFCDGEIHQNQLSTPIRQQREEFVMELMELFSCRPESQEEMHRIRSKSGSLSSGVLNSVGIQTDDPAGWIRKRKAKCGSLTNDYFNVKDENVADLLDTLTNLLNNYNRRVESIESFVYMHCVGIQLEKHFSKRRAEALEGFEKKTDITTAINLAAKKRLPLLVQELEAKLEAVAPNVSHTMVKETKETHLRSKAIKNELSELAMRRFRRARETSMDRLITIMTEWSKHEEVSVSKEVRALEVAAEEVERSIKYIEPNLMRG